MKTDNSHRVPFLLIIFIGSFLQYTERDSKIEIRTNAEGWKVIAEKSLTLETTGYRIDTTGDKTKVLSLAPGKTRKEKLFFSDESLKEILEEKKPAAFSLGQSKKKRNIEAWYFPGSGNKRALVIGGVHGTELSAIEVATTLINTLKKAGNNYYSVIIIPCLFPDNAATAENRPREIGSTRNIGRYSFSTSPDPNRQMPTPGEPFDEKVFKDHLGREIEKENRLLLQLISVFRPDRIANIHGTRDMSNAGIFADPRTDSQSHALGFETDSSLAIAMASLIYTRNGWVPGNKLENNANALYYKDPLPVAKGLFQERNLCGSSLSSKRGYGISLGTWASTAILCARDSQMNRAAMRIITMEFPAYKRSYDYKNKEQQNYFRQQVQLHASSIEMIFLREYFVEENITKQGAESVAKVE